MKKRLLCAAIVASLGLGGSMNAFATADRTATGPTTENYPSELDISGSGALLESGAGVLDFLIPLGSGLTTGADRYIRFDLNGGTFATIALAAGGGDLTIPAATVGGISQGGQIGDTFVIYTVTPTGSMAALDTVDFDPGVTGTDILAASKAAVTMTYRLYETQTSANAGADTDILASKANEPYITFSPTFALTTTGKTATAEVNDGFITFITGNTATAPSQNLGTITYALAATVPTKPDGTGAMTLADVLGPDTAIRVNGDFNFVFDADGTATSAGALARIFLATADTCPAAGAVSATSIAADGTSASFTVATTANANTFFCVTSNTGTGVTNNAGTIPITTLTADLVVQSAGAGFAPVDLTAQAAGNITHNGATLIAPFTTLSTAYGARFYLNNLGGSAADFTLKVLDDQVFDGAANVAGKPLTLTVTSGTIPANGSLLMNVKDIATGKRGGFVFNIAAPCADVTGVIQMDNFETKNFNSVPMVRPVPCGTN